MAISLKSLTRKAEIKPPRILVYGVEGIGKSTFAANAPNPVFLWTEDGQGALDVAGWPVAKTFDDVLEMIGVLANEKHDFNTVVIDTLDWLEPLVWAKVVEEWNEVEEKQVDEIESIGYGKGYKLARKHWRMYLEGLSVLNKQHNMAIIQIAHNQIKRFDSPETEPYDRYVVKLHEQASSLVREFSDVVAFANYHVSVLKTDVGFKKDVSRGVGGARYLYLSEKPAYQAKNRYNMGDKCGLKWDDFASHLPGGSNFKPAIEVAEEAAEEPTEETTEEPQEAEQAQEPKKKEKAA